MKILYLDSDPSWAARYHVDGHISGQINKTVELLYSAHLMLDGPVTMRARVGEFQMVRRSMVTRSYSRWVRETTANYEWTRKLLSNLILEWQARTHSMHSREQMAQIFKTRPLNLQMGELTPMPQDELPERFRRSDPVFAHRVCYAWMPKELAVWSHPAERPEWWPGFDKRGGEGEAA